MCGCQEGVLDAEGLGRALILITGTGFDSNPMAYHQTWAHPILAPDQQFA